ncbi:MAG: VanZ family protein [Ruminococcus sp.]|nr:VanZ family protein [Ruminococcus sp.]
MVLVFAATVIFVRRLYKKNKLNKRIAVITILLVFYILVVLFYTVLGRRTQEDYYHISIDVFDSYTRLFLCSDPRIISEALLNIVVFVPVGVAVCFIFERHRVFYAVIIGVALSLLIELSQFILQNGYSEITDLIHNTLGALIGAVVTVAAVYISKAIIKRKAESRMEINE